MKKEALSCIVCDKKHESIYGRNQPNGGLAFTSRGHYGTTFFDPMDESAIEINVCDECLVRAQAKKQILHHPINEQTTLLKDAPVVGSNSVVINLFHKDEINDNAQNGWDGSMDVSDL